MPTPKFIKVREVPQTAQFVSDSQDVEPLREYVPHGKTLSAAFVTIADGDYVTIYALYNGETVPYLDRVVRVVNVESYLKYNLRSRLAMRTKRAKSAFAIVKPKTHWIGMAGLRGYMPNYCEVYSSEESACDSLIDMHDLNDFPTTENTERINDLRSTGWCDLDIELHGNEYCEVSECDCDNPAQHSDSGTFED